MKRLKGKEIFLIVSLFLILFYALVYYFLPGFQEDIKVVNSSLETFARNHGYLGALVVSFAGTISIFIVIPYPAFIFLLATAGLNIWALSFIAGLGAALGEVTGYLIGYIGGRLTDKHHAERFSKVKRFIENHPKSTPLIIYLFGATPLPDDIIFIPLGLVKYSFKKAFVPGFLGKFTLLLIVAYVGTKSIDWLGLAAAGFISQIITLILTVLIIYAILKINWEKF